MELILRGHDDRYAVEQLQLALFPADTAKRMVVLSDGRETVGDASEVARLAAASNVQIDYVFLGSSAQQEIGPEVLVTDVRLPATVNVDEEFDLTVTVASSECLNSRGRSSCMTAIFIASGSGILTPENRPPSCSISRCPKHCFIKV